MSRQLSRASSDYLNVMTAVVTAYPFTLACWIRSLDVTNSQYVLGVGRSGGGGLAYLNCGGNASGDPIRIVITGSVVAGVTTTGYSASTWHHICAVFTSATSRAVFIDGGSKGTNTDNISFLSPQSDTVIGQLGTSGAFFDGRVAEAAIWNTNLSDAQVANLGADKHAPSLVQTANLAAYWPLISDDNDASGNGFHLTANSLAETAFQEHPPGIIYSLDGVNAFPIIAHMRSQGMA